MFKSTDLSWLRTFFYTFYCPTHAITEIDPLFVMEKLFILRDHFWDKDMVSNFINISKLVVHFTLRIFLILPFRRTEIQQTGGQEYVDQVQALIVPAHRH